MNDDSTMLKKFDEMEIPPNGNWEWSALELKCLAQNECVYERQIHSFKLAHVIFQSYQLQNVTTEYEEKTHKLI